ncbi:uncharacterized protein LOC6556824 [Drosophila grimshawi]|uniref:GH16679 n=1 Tax=Drosophila grimshawi TaxID=7222 RepID=B4J2Y8_DROGR|nr:uncharacterized protein LOC6556824 [Drosophila grimshawi]EDV97158.1 GH16679 [Drosophila grimshawi]
MEDLTREEVMAFSNINISNNNNSNHNTNSNNNGKVHMCSSTAANKLEQQQHLSHSLLPCIKLDPDRGWPVTPVNDHMRLDLNSNKLLLQGSDDPLISHGASNDPHDEDQDYPFKVLLARKTLEEEHAVQNGACSTLTKQQLKANLMNARKMQRQPQVQELSKTPAPTQQRVARQSKSKKRSTPTGAIKLRFHHQALPAEYAAHYEATQRRHLSSARTVPSVPPVKATPPPQNQSHENVRSWLRKIAEIQRSAERQQQAQESGKASQPARVEPVTAAITPLEPVVEPVSSSKRNAIKYADLPYMGEITLDNYKPRRGRKPKKADICHLIYKNYGTIIPAAEHFPVVEPKCSPAPTAVTAPMPTQRVVSSRVSTILSEEPLNLCLRDRSSDRYSISSGDSDKPSTVTNATTSTTECGSSSHRVTPLIVEHIAIGPPDLKISAEEKPRISAKLLLQPVGLYYQQLMENCRLGVPLETIEKDNQLALKIPIPNGFFATTNTATTSCSSTADKREPLEQSIETATTMRKRKRSAIYIPPMQADHSSSPSTEVSICKFKFTGGAKPTLQEKKMLSVDAEGNYRYYNGTGDRTMRGYEFISREQQQQQQQHLHQPLNPTNGSNDKLYIDIPPPSTDLSLELLHIPSESPTSSLLLSSSLVPVAPQSPSSYSNSHSPMHPPEDCHKRADTNDQHKSMESPRPVTVAAVKRRSSRRSKQREKLEKTFKEKGFLIQTQQLQSAEGATYCKFRQLKKFTRYLFRNWKDHIPESDLCKHQVKDSDVRSQHSVLENILAGQIGLGVENLGSVSTAANQAST